jgi:hypothetical protein
MARRHQASLVIKKGESFGMLARRARQNGSAEPVRRREGVRGGGTVARWSPGKETGRKKIEQRMSAWNDGGDTCKKASKPGSMVGITQHKRGGAAADKVILLSARGPGFTEGWRDHSSPRWPRAEAQASVKRWSM